MIIGIIFVKVLKASLAASLMVFLMLLLKKVMGKRLSPRLTNALWLLVSARLLMIFLPFQSQISIFNALPAIENAISFNTKAPSSAASISDDKPASRSFARPAAAIQDNLAYGQVLPELKSSKSQIAKSKPPAEKVTAILSYVWGTVFILMMLYAFFLSFNYKRKSKKYSRIDNDEIRQIYSAGLQTLNIKKAIPLYFMDNCSSPFISGIIRPRIYIPQNILETVNSEELYYIFLHELSHYKRKDILSNLVSTVCLMLHWFNPLIWYAAKAMKTDREIACDACVLERIADEESVNYGMTLLKFLRSFSHNNNRLILLNFYEDKPQIERRILMIKRFKKGADKVSVAALILAIGICFTTVTDAVDNGNVPSTSSNTVSQTNNNELKFRIETEDYTFNSLQRSMDFIDPQFKVPSYMTSGCELFQYQLFKKRVDNQDMFYEHTINRNQQSPEQGGYTFIASKGNLLKYIEKETGQNIKNSQKPMKLSFINGASINGTSMTIISKFDKESWSGEDASTAPAQITLKNFIWSDNGIWYYIQYYYEMIDNNKKKQVSQNISVNELTQIVSSLKYPKDIKNRDAFSTNKLPFYIYDEKDFEAAKKQLNYSVKFPINIGERAKLVNARRFENSVFYMQYNPTDPEAVESVGTIQFYQCTEKSNFKDLGNGYIELNKAGSFGMRKMEAQKIKVGGTDVFVIPAPEGSHTTGTFYAWVENGICYQVLMSPKNSTDLLKPFISAKTY